MSIIIAIDGPSGSGKTTVARLVADSVELEWLSSGALYRAITKLVLDGLKKDSSVSSIVKMLETVTFQVLGEEVNVNSVDVTKLLHVPEIDREISRVSAITEVRETVNSILRNQVGNKSYIIEGRDIGTEVFPSASIKVYLDSSSHTRALRRSFQRGIDPTSLEFKRIKSEIKERDFNDRNKKRGTLRISEDAEYIDTTHLTVKEVCDMVFSIINHNSRKDVPISYE